ncbi:MULTISPECIES: hypothetical protein [Bacteroidales]|jgi:hypothetical protein|uniref:hypothetical protein n=1 Tax=Bacteroidales TaxID=171549 RepID=UPI00057410C5|nr:MULTISPECIES: hypothetical protein [Bacteroidales]KHM48522.1 membrane protein [Coprobacter secundus]
MKIVWKLLRQHLSIGQFAGFFLANLVGMIIVLFSLQFYKDVAPFFSGNDNLLKSEYLILSKKISTLGSITGQSTQFSEADLEEIKEQSFVKNIGEFTSSQYHVSAGINMAGQQMRLSTQMFFESVPDAFVDIKSTSDWHFDERDDLIPIILPKNYLNLYNYGFAQSRSLPQLSEGILGLIGIDIHISGNGQNHDFKGNIVGFSNRLNTILVPESFMKWSNKIYGDGRTSTASRIIIEVDNPADDNIVQFLQKKGYETEGDKLNAGKTNYFLKIITGLVIGIGLIISILSFFVLMLSIYLLLQKNTQKLENLLLIGYSPAQVSRPYQLLTIGLNSCVLIISLAIIFFAREYYIALLNKMWPSFEGENIFISTATGILLFLAISIFNIIAIRHKVNSLWDGTK